MPFAEAPVAAGAGLQQSSRPTELSSYFLAPKSSCCSYRLTLLWYSYPSKPQTWCSPATRNRCTWTLESRRACKHSITQAPFRHIRRPQRFYYILLSCIRDALQHVNCMAATIEWGVVPPEHEVGTSNPKATKILVLNRISILPVQP
jgi:hypothetical protein